MLRDVGDRPSTRIVALDGWRGAAILLVLVGHFVPNLGGLARLGVEFFFLLSGRLMAEILIERRAQFDLFYWRRFSRIVPALLFFVLVCSVLGTISEIFAAPRVDVLAVTTFWSNYLYTFEARTPIFGHTWSLAIEEHAYILLGLIAMLAARRVKVVVAVMAVLIAVGWIRGVWLTWGEGLDFYQVYWRSDVRAASLLLGFWLYLILRFYEPAWLRACCAAPHALLASLFAVVMIMYGPFVADPVKYTLGTLILGLLLIAVERGIADGRQGVVFRCFVNRKLIALGLISYSVYLYQQIFHVAKAPLPGWMWPMMMPLAVAAGWMSYSAVEVPARRALNRLGDRLFRREVPR